jgi:hypothetical protein
MKAFTGQLCCIAALAGVAALYLNRKAKCEEHASSCEGGAASSMVTSASNNVINNPYLVQSILDFVGPGQHLYISTISKLMRQCCGKVEVVQVLGYRMIDGALMNIVVNSQMTRYSEMCRSKSRLLLAVQCGVQLAPQGPMLQRTADRLLATCRRAYVRRLDAQGDAPWRQKMALGRYADKALLAFAYDHLGLPFYSIHVTTGAVMSGDLAKLQWLCFEKRATADIQSSILAARYGQTHILTWLFEIGFPIDAATCCEAAFRGNLEVLQLLHAKAHEWHEKCGLVAAVGGHLAVVQWLGEHGCAYENIDMTLQAAYYGHVHIIDWLMLQEGAQLCVDVMEAAAAGGQLLMYQHLRSIGCAWDTSVCSAAAFNGQHDVLQYLRELDAQRVMAYTYQQAKAAVCTSCSI